MVEPIPVGQLGGAAATPVAEEATRIVASTQVSASFTDGLLDPDSHI
jgi:hypothetical protein